MRDAECSCVSCWKTVPMRTHSLQKLLATCAHQCQQQLHLLNMRPRGQRDTLQHVPSAFLHRYYHNWYYEYMSYIVIIIRSCTQYRTQLLDVDLHLRWFMYEYIPSWVARDGVRGERTCGPSTPSLEFVGPALFTSQLTPRRDLAMRLRLRACINVLNTPSQKTTTRYT